MTEPILAADVKCPECGRGFSAEDVDPGFRLSLDERSIGRAELRVNGRCESGHWMTAISEPGLPVRVVVPA